MLAAMSEQDKAEMMRQMDERMKDVAHVLPRRRE
jgi:hypothetical protein